VTSSTSSSKPRRSPLERSFRRYAIGLAATLGTLMAIFGIVNTRVNPIGVTPTPWTDTAYRDYRPIYRAQRSAKPGLIRSEKWDAVFVGSSRVDYALDPSNPHWGDMRVANLAFVAGTLPESAPMLKYAADHQNLKLAIAGIDLYDLSNDSSLIANSGFSESPLNPEGDPIERELRYIFGYTSVQSSYHAILDRAHHTLVEYSANGFRLRPKIRGEQRKRMETDSLPQAIRYIRQRQAVHKIFPAKLAALQTIIDTAKSKGFRLILMIPPSNGIFQATYFYSNDPDPAFDMERELIVKLAAEANAAHPGTPPVEVWDFYDFHPLNCESPAPLEDKETKMKYWLDGTHASKVLGDIMLARMMGWPVDDPLGADYGMRLTPDNVGQRPEQIRAGYEKYRTEHPEDFKFMTEVADKYRNSNTTAPAEAEE